MPATAQSVRIPDEEPKRGVDEAMKGLRQPARNARLRKIWTEVTLLLPAKLCTSRTCPPITAVKRRTLSTMDADVMAAMGISGFGKQPRKRQLDAARFDKAKREEVCPS
jgi:hypothetical protein